METLQKLQTSRSTGLDHFALNCFRVLNLPVTIAEEEAFQVAERHITMIAAQISPTETRLLPSLGECSEAEVRMAATNIEEPLERLVHELLWFEPEDDDGYGKMLMHYLQTEDSGLNSYLRSAVYQTGDSDTVNLTTRINQANLRFLAGLQSLHANQQPEDRAALPLTWSKKEGLLMVEDPHLTVGQDKAATSAAEAAGYLSAACHDWSEILNHPDWENFINGRLDRLQDELLDGATGKLLGRTIPARLADVVALEIKNKVMSFEWETVRELLKIVNTSGFDTATWRAALAPINTHFQNEISQLAEPIEEQEEVSHAQLLNYFNAIDRLKVLWQLLDPEDRLATNSLTDEAVRRGYRILTRQALVPANFIKIELLLDRAAAIVANASLKEQIINYKDKIRMVSEYGVCHFCEKAPPNDKYPTILEGKKETGRDYNTIYYQLRFEAVPRCEQCANIHQFSLTWGGWLCVPIVMGVLFLVLAYLFNSDEEYGVGTVIIGLALIIGSGFIGFLILREIIHSHLVPATHKKFSEVNNTKGYQRLTSESFSITILSNKTALDTIKSRQRK